MKQNEQLVEDLFELFIMRIIWGDVLWSDKSFEYTRTLQSFIATKELMGRESAGVVVYVNNGCARRLEDSEYIDHIIRSEVCVFYKNKAIIQLFEEE